MTTIKVQQWPTALAASRGTILDTALAAGVPYPYGCRSGDCGSCKSRMLSGEVTMEGYYTPEALTAAEREAGLILACRARPLTDVAVTWLAPVTATSVRGLPSAAGAGDDYCSGASDPRHHAAPAVYQRHPIGVCCWPIRPAHISRAPPEAILYGE